MFESTENKELFVQALQAAFIAGDSRRYGYLAIDPVKCVRDEETGEESLVYTSRRGYPVNITGGSPAAIAKAFIKYFV